MRSIKTTLRCVLRWRTALYVILGTTAVWQIENYRGHRRFAEVSAKLAATGDDLSWSHGIPAAVPDELNATRHPVFAGTQSPRAYSFGYAVDFAPLQARATAGIPHDLASVDGSDPRAVLAATATFGDTLTELHQAFERPHCYWFMLGPDTAVTPTDEPLPAISNLTSSTVSFLDLAALRTRAHLALGNPSTAARELVAIVDLIRSTGRGTSRLGALLQSSALDAATPRLAEIITAPGWDAGSLANIADSLAGVALLDSVDASIRRDRAARAGYLRTNAFTENLGSTPFTTRLLVACGHLIPQGLLDQNAANQAAWTEDSMIAYYDPTTGRVDPGPHPKPIDYVLGTPTPYNFMVNLSLSDFSSIYQQAAAAQTSAGLLRLLCAIERHQIEHGQRPTSLTELVPHYITALPVDPVTGLPPHYTADKNGNLTLASLDWHRTTNPGTFAAVVSTGPPTHTIIS